MLVGSSVPFPEVPDLPARADRRGCVCPVAAPCRALRAAHSQAGGQEERSASDLVGPPFCRTGNRGQPRACRDNDHHGAGSCRVLWDLRLVEDLGRPLTPTASVLPCSVCPAPTRARHRGPLCTHLAEHSRPRAWCHRPGMQEDGLGSWHGGVAVHQECASCEDNYAFGGYAQ